MRPVVHLTTVLTPLVVFGLMERLFRFSGDLPWVVTVIGLVTGSVTVLLVRPGLRQLVATPWIGLGLFLAGVLLIITTPLLGWQQVRSSVEAAERGLAAQLPWLLSALILVLAGWVLLVTARRITRLPQVLTPLYLVAGEVLLLLVLEGRWFLRVVMVVFAFLLFVALEDLYLAFHQPVKHHEYASANIATYLGLVTFFLFAASLLWLMIFFAFPLWLASLLLGGMTVLLTSQALWAIGSSLIAGLPYLVIVPMITIEMFWAVSFLPTSVYVGGFLLTASYYVASGLGRNSILGTLNRQVASRYLMISSCSILLVLLFAKCQVARRCIAVILNLPDLVG